MTETDASAGQLLQALEESSQADNAIVVFSADNGPEKYAYARDANFDHWSAYPLRGLKRDIYEGGHRVPFLIRWPGVTEAGTTNESLVSQIDLMATFADALDFELPSDQAHDSHNLLPLLKGEVDRIRDTHIHNTYEGQWAIRHGDWVLVDHKDGYHTGRVADWETKHKYPADDDQPAELFNLVEDLEQRHNLASRYPEKVENLRKRMAEIRNRGHSAPRLAGH